MVLGGASVGHRVGDGIAGRWWRQWGCRYAVVGDWSGHHRIFALQRPNPWCHHAALFMGGRQEHVIFGAFVLAWYAVVLSQGPEAAMAPVTALWLLAIPLMDTVTVMARRIAKGLSPFQGDRKHLHHVLRRAGLSPGLSVAVIVLGATFLACIGIVGSF